VLAFSAYLPDVEGVELDWEAARSIPVLVQHGTDDPLIPVDAGRALARTLIDRGVPTTYSEFPMGHSVAMAGLEEAHAWLLAVRARRRRLRCPSRRPSRW
jgi:phospholipase/carboxylesterase